MYAPPYADTAPPPTSKVELKVSCKGLANRDLTSFSDPQVFLFVEDSIGQWSKTPYAKTECIKDTLNPTFVQGLQIDYRFSVVQKLRFVVYDIDDKHSGSFSDQDFQGEVVTDLASIISAPGGQLSLKLYHPKFKQVSQDRGKITIRSEELKESKRVFSFTLKAKDLTKKGMFKTAPSAFVVIQRRNQNGTFSPVYKTPVVPNNDDPKWKPFNIKENILCNGDPNRELRFDVMSWKASGTHTLIGSTPITTPAKLSQQPAPYVMPLPGIRDTTALVLEGLRVHEPPSFVDFMRGGGAINLTVAIDFTQSNGDPSNPSSLHFRHPSGDNEYTRAIRAVGTVLEAYDSDKRIPVYGFGGKIGNEVSFAFPLNGDNNNPEVVGVDGILHAYWQSMSRVQLWGPTNFSPMIRAASNIAKQSEATGGYSVLLILTDGAITDFVETMQSIRAASKLPLSIIIVGVGGADFGKMSLLDGDEEAESSVSLKNRDITQFVAARDYGPQNIHMLASALLQELPEQFMEYMSLNNKQPRPIQPAATMYDPAVAAVAATAVAAHPPPLHAPPAAAHPGPAPGYPHSPSLAPVVAPATPYAAPAYPPPGTAPPAVAPGYPHSPSLAPVAPGAPAYAAPTTAPPPIAGAPGYPHSPSLAPVAAAAAAGAAVAGHSAPAYPPPGTAPPAVAPGYPHSPSLATVAPGAPAYAAPTTAPPPIAGAHGYPHSPSLAPGSPAYAAPTAAPPPIAGAPGYPPPGTAPPAAHGAPGYAPPASAPPAGSPAPTPAAAAPGYPPPGQPYPGYPHAHQYPGYQPQAQPYYGYPPAQPGYPGHPPAGHPYPGYPPAQPYYGYAYPPAGHAPYGAAPYPGQYAPPAGPPPPAAGAGAPGAPPVSAPPPGAPPVADPHAAAAAGHQYQPYHYGAYAPPAGPPPPLAGAPPAVAPPTSDVTAKAATAAAGPTDAASAAAPPPPGPPGATPEALAASVASLSIASAAPPPPSAGATPGAAPAAPAAAAPGAAAATPAEASGYVSPPPAHRPAAPQSYTG
ncbi:hypothetical protein DFQ27_004847 [Actinomortierella ambigua]|uniref:Copine n=1 Tax=Actinomortierella ambigua TaxID=1343610 RepID=A0A9P6QHZ0_9FUNG|nr:hypothetical protein DFQ27_004847 [Actinomortierella ambigua]